MTAGGCRDGTSWPYSAKKSGRPLGGKALAIREAVLALADEHKVMTVRGIFYALTTRGIVPKDETAGYRPVQRQVLNLRREGLLRWTFLADGTRWQRKPRSWNSVEDALASWSTSYRRDLWGTQRVRVEVWLEKDALAGVVVEKTREWDIPLMVSRGMSSATFLYSAGAAAAEAWEEDGVETHVLTLYDLDPAGERASRNVEHGLREHALGAPVHCRHLAVTRAQVEAWNLPTRPTKRSDPEAHKFTGDSVELDAIPPDRLQTLVENAIVDLIDPHAWKVQQAVEAEEKAGLQHLLG